jgi:branched-chain amino acid transport system permease protein
MDILVDNLAIVGIEIVNAIATLVLVSIGLAIVFGMMKVINLAHGEFIMLGSYAAVFATRSGINIWIAMLVVAPLVVAALGVIVERLVIRHLYGRMVDTMLATWGLSLFLVGGITAIFGNTTSGISPPLGSMQVGAYAISLYTTVIVAVAVVAVLLVLVLLKGTQFGLVARGVMQNAGMAAALGISTGRVYSTTFALGAALAGLAGGVLAPITGVVPTIGVAYVAKAFITVIGGGASILAGTLSASTIFGMVNQTASFATTPVIGEVALLFVAIVLVRLLPQGITGRFFRGWI